MLRDTSSTRIDSVRIWTGIVFKISPSHQTLAITRIIGAFFYTNIYFHWTTWDSMWRYFKNVLRRISIWFITWCGQESTWGSLCQFIFFIRYCYLWPLQQPETSSMSPPWINLSPIATMICRRLLNIWTVSNLTAIWVRILQIVMLKSWLMLGI